MYFKSISFKCVAPYVVSMKLVQNGAKGCVCPCHNDEADDKTREFVACSSCLAVVCSALICANVGDVA